MRGVGGPAEGTMPVMRIWHGRVRRERADDYERFLIERAAPDYASVEGLLRLYFTRRDEGDVAHFLLVTVWDSMESMRRFAGDDPELAKYYPEDDEFLLEKEERVQIYRVFYER